MQNPDFPPQKNLPPVSQGPSEFSGTTPAAFTPPIAPRPGATSPSTSQSGVCDHAQPSDVARMAEEYLRSKGISESAWDNSRFGFGGDGGTGPFRSVYTEIERRQETWVAIKLDRRKEALPAELTGFRVVAIPNWIRTGE